MREGRRKQVKVVYEHDPAEYERKCNEIGTQLAQWNPDIETDNVEENGVHYFVAQYTYTECENVPEDLGDWFSTNGSGCTCKDCPFLEIGKDARRKYFPCAYAEYGETHMDAPACEVFYKEAVKRMREASKNADKE